MKREMEESEKISFRLNIKKNKQTNKKKTLRSCHPAPSLNAKKKKKGGSRDRFSLLGLQNHCMVTAAMKSRDYCFLAGK